MKASKVALALVAATLIIAVSGRADTPPPLMGCCTCPSIPKCDNATELGCASQREHDPTCMFVLGGRCQLDRCVGGQTEPTATDTPGVTPTETGAPTPTDTTASTPTETALGTPTDTPVATPTDTGGPTPTDTAAPTPTDTGGATPTDTPAVTPTDTGGPISTATPTGLATPTGTATSTLTVTGTVTPTPTPTATATPRCKSTPVPGCRKPSPSGRWPFSLRTVNGARRRLVWKWRGGMTNLADFGDPLTTTDYTLCVYAGPEETPLLEITAPAGGTCLGRPCWKAKGNARQVRRYKYADSNHSSDGIARVVLRGRPSVARAHLVVVGRGDNLPLPDLPLEGTVRAQLVKSDAADCWEATYSAPALKNTQKRYRDKND